MSTNLGDWCRAAALLGMAAGTLGAARSAAAQNPYTITTPEGRQQLVIPSEVPAAVAPRPNTGYDGLPDNPSQPVRVAITSPAEGEVVEGGPVDVFLEADNYTLAEGGNRLRVILNNDPPVDVADVRAPVTFRELPEGGHTVRVMAVGPDGRALRHAQSYAAVHFFVGRKDFQNYAGPGKPQLIVNLPPEGAVDVPEGGKVWLDALTVNAPLAEKDGYKVAYTINGVEGTLAKSEPIYWVGLKPGKYVFEAQLVTSEGVPVQGIFNHVTRNVEVRVTERAEPLAPEAAGVIAVAAAPALSESTDPTQAHAAEPGADAATAVAVAAPAVAVPAAEEGMAQAEEAPATADGLPAAEAAPGEAAPEESATPAPSPARPSGSKPGRRLRSTDGFAN